jgi:hypothetical protein
MSSPEAIVATSSSEVDSDTRLAGYVKTSGASSSTGRHHPSSVEGTSR